MAAHPVIYIISGGVGSSGEHLVKTVLAQFPEAQVEVSVFGNVRDVARLEEVLHKAQSQQALIVHTLVDEQLRLAMKALARDLGLSSVDLTSDLIAWLSSTLGQAPVGRPGLYRQLNRQYFERVAAIDYSMAHDDGKNPAGWPDADLVLVGVSRVGKTPLSLYLAVLGYKTANYPLVPQIPVPEALFELDPNRVVGVTTSYDQLLLYRLQRQAHLGVGGGASAYVDREAVEEELREAKRIFRKGGFRVLDMTNKTIEMGADEIIRWLSTR